MMASSTGVAGRRVLLADDEYLFATKMARAFAELGVETIGPVGTVKRALNLVERSGRLDAAVLDIKLRDGVVYPVAEALRARGVPFVFTTGYGEHAIPDRYKDVGRYRSRSIRPKLHAHCLQMRANPRSRNGIDTAFLHGTPACCVADPQRLNGACAWVELGYLPFTPHRLSMVRFHATASRMLSAVSFTDQVLLRAVSQNVSVTTGATLSGSGAGGSVAQPASSRMIIKMMGVLT